MFDIFVRFFAKKQQVTQVREVAALAASLATPAVHLVKTGSNALSHFGGSPDLPPGVPWPEHNGKKLGFLARLSLAELHRALRIDWLPSTGVLLFFYDIEKQPWGFDPKDRGRWSVLYVPEHHHAIVPIEQRGGAFAAHLPHRNIAFQPIDVLPSWERDTVRQLEFSDKESDLYFDLADAVFKGRPKHQVAGYPSPVQGDDMELECQLVSNGLYCGDTTCYNDPRAPALKTGAANWRLLLQVDTDDELGMMWGDSGILYFWVEEEAARRGDFTNSWVILQCF